ncbi:Trp biosynthesis-associated membrane protein [Nocardioides sp. LS1]|uniref:Trp biosynthesis-associated membrane protein n=1 Tax=Nocardioides sp. LS1 TaxID=1027620 RepID=UPI000F625898|nr:Trp biosynthesis-associated membrane protein [Nocardioides sp. LS1]GCD89498.1 hypothetical protein NLS1_15040 [Nocardioides sp. LS1]
MAERSRRRTFGPVVLLGLAAGTLTAVAGNKTWATVDVSARSTRLGADWYMGFGGSVDAGKMPVTTALALVVLAAWGVVLVTRGRVRRGVAVLGALAAIGTLAAVVVGWSQVGDSLRADLSGVGVLHASTSHTGWFWAAAVGAVLSVLSSVLAVLLTPQWPEMGSRYDAPTGGDDPAPPATPLEEQTNIDLWKAMDEGHDPTA